MWLALLWFDLLSDQLLHNKMSTSNQTVYSFQDHMVIIMTTVVIRKNNNNNHNHNDNDNDNNNNDNNN